jgi:hypothetical protein
MFHRKNLFVILFIALVMAFVPALLNARPAGAQVDLHAGKGEAVWFYRSCTPARPGAVATWKVEPNPSVPSRTSLNFQVKNAYPGYQLVCELYFANTGKIPIGMREITVSSPNPKELILSAAIAPGEQRKILKPCGFKPSWGKNPASFPLNCQSKMKLMLTIGPNVQENSHLTFSVQVRLQAKLDD